MNNKIINSLGAILVLIVSTCNVFSQSNPAPYMLSQSNYSLIQWPSNSASNTYPAAMVFQTCTTQNANLSSPTTGDYKGVYNGSTGMRVNGLGSNGFYFAGAYNASPTLGAAVLGLNSIGRGNITVSFQAYTFSNGNPANLRLQYRIASNNSNWVDVPGPVEYVSNGLTALNPVTYNVDLSTLTGGAINNRPDFQLRWKYYRTSGTGANDCSIALDEVTVSSQPLSNAAISSGLAPALSYCVTPTEGTELQLNFSYTPSSSFSVGSNFVAEISNSSGSFTAPVSCGNIQCDGTGNQNITVTIPPNTGSGNGYRLRVINASNGIIGNDNGADITVYLVPNAVSNIVPNNRNKEVYFEWTNPVSCWDEVMVVARQGSIPSTVPIGNGTNFTASPIFGLGTNIGGGFVVFKGTGNAFTLNGLTSDISYGIVIWTRYGESWISSNSLTVLTPSIPSISETPKTVKQAEYFWNYDPGNGNGTPFQVVDGAYDNAFENIFSQGLQAPKKGVNILNVRVKDSYGTWSNVFSSIVNVDSTENFVAGAGYKNATIVQAEYWWNNDPGIGNGTVVVALDGNLNNVFEHLSVQSSPLLKYGRSTFNVRVKDNNNNWSTTYSTVVNIDSSDFHRGYTQISLGQAEYWWNSDPGVGNATPIIAFDGNYNSAFEALFANNILVPKIGRSTFNVRIKDVNNQWSNTFTTIINVDSTDSHLAYPLTKMLQAECWWNTDPGVGNGVPLIAMDGNLNQAFENFFINNQQVSKYGRSLFGVRVKATDNVWSAPFYTVINVDSSDSNVGYKLDKLVQAEYWWNNDPGVGNATPLLAMDGNLDQAFEGLVSTGVIVPKKGRSTFNVRVKDNNNNWSPVFTTLVNVDSINVENTIFSKRRIKQQELFWDVDPGEGNGTTMVPSDLLANSAFETFKISGNQAQNLPNGVHLLCMRAKDEYGNWGSVFKTTIDVNFIGNVFAVYTNPSYSVICKGDSVKLSALGGVSYAWSPSSGLNTTVGASVIAKPQQTTTYKVIGVNQFGLTDTAYVKIEVTSPGKIINDSIIDICPGTIVELESTAENGNYWSTGQTSKTINVTSGGVYQLINENGCGLTTSRVLINTLPVTKPTITADGPVQFCVGGGVTLTASEGVTFQWSNGSIDPATYVQESGKYAVTVTPDGGCPSISDTISVQVSDVPNAIISASGATSFCQGSYVTLNAPVAANFTYQWLNEGLEIENATSSSLNIINTGNYNCIVTKFGCASLSNIISVNVNELPQSTITYQGATSICAGSSISLQGPVGQGITYQWKLNNTTINGANSSTYLASVAGDYSLVLSNGSCSSMSEFVTISVKATPTANITSTGSTTFCQGGSVTFTGSVAAGNSYQWYLNNNLINGANGQSYTANSSGNFYVAITKNGCTTNSTTRSVTVNPLPIAVINPSGPTTYCKGGSVTLNATPGAGYTYQWKFNNLNLSGATNASYTPMQAGNYTLTVLKNSCSAVSQITTVVIGQPFSAAISSVGSQVLCEGDSTVFNVLPSNASSYKWMLNDTLIYDGVSSLFSSKIKGSYKCQVVKDGCTSTTSSIIINPLPNAGLINGNDQLCVGSQTTLTPSILGGAWSVDNTALATVDLQGNVTGNTAGLVKVNYSITSLNGCLSKVSKNLEIKSLPQIIGTNSVCVGNSSTLLPSIQGGSWSITSGSSLVSIVNGTLTTINTGEATVIYTLSNNDGGCQDSIKITVQPLPDAGSLSGNNQICLGSQTTLTPSITGGTWSVSNDTIASVDQQGNVLGISIGTVLVNYTLTSENGCISTVSKSVEIINLPQIISSNKLCVGSQLALTSSIQGGTWSIITGSDNASLNNGILTGNVAGNTTISYTLNDISLGCQSSLNITINPLPSVDSIIGNDKLCLGTQTTLTSSSSGGTWSIIGNSLASINQQGNFSGSTVGNVIVNYTITSENGCSSTVSKTIEIVNSAEILSSSSICLETKSTLLASIAGGTWTILSGTNKAIITNGEITGKDTGNVILQYTISGINSMCSNNVTKTFTVHPKPVVGTLGGTLTSTGKFALCPTTTRVITKTVNGGIWSSKNTAIATVINGVVTGVAPGSTSINYTITNPANGCTNTATMPVIVDVKPGIPVIYGTNVTLCQSGKAFLTVSVPNGKWSTNDIYLKFSTLNNGMFYQQNIVPTDNFISGVKYTISSSNNACTSVGTKEVKVRKVAQKAVTISATSTNLNLNQQVTATASTIMTATGTWRSFLPTALSVTVNAANNKQAVVKGIGIGTNGYIMYQAKDPITGCSNGGWLSFNVISATSLVDAFERPAVEGLHIFPNPSNGKFTIENTEGASTVKLIDLSGRVIAKQSIVTGTVAVDFSGVATGKYMLQIFGESINEVHSIVIE